MFGEFAMPEWFQSIAEQVPSLLVLVWLVWSNQKDRKLHQDEWLTAMREVSALCHENQTKATEVIKDNTEMFGRVKEIMSNVRDELRIRHGG